MGARFFSFLTILLAGSFAVADLPVAKAGSPVAKGSAGGRGEFLRKVALRALSYNIKGLPSIALGKYDENRYAEIGRRLAERQKEGRGFDFVLLQESFSERTKELREVAGYPFMAKGPEANSILGVDGGLYILSRHPIVRQTTREFGTGNCASWDCYAAKGVQYARIELPGVPFPFEIYNTHLQASRQGDGIRRRQVKILLEFFRETHVPGAAVLFAGDFNFRPGLGHQSYLDFLQAPFLHVGKFCLEAGCARGRDEGWHGLFQNAVDHHFVGTGEGRFHLLPTRVERTFGELVGGRRLSDHLGYEADYELRWGNPPTRTAQKNDGTPSPRRLPAQSP
jgi:endonuclease/exonuclease/phosphatase family metal-dependent hydrolase